jgi:hypothetical protein
MQNGIKALKIEWGMDALFRQHCSPLFTIAHKNIGIPRYCQVTGHKFMHKSISFEKSLSIWNFRFFTFYCAISRRQ